MDAINDQEFIEFKTGKTIAELIQNDLDAISEQSKRTGKPILQYH